MLSTRQGRLAMGRVHRWTVAFAVFAGGAVFAYATAGRVEGSAAFTEAQVVAVDVIGRTLVIRSAGGVETKVQLDDNLAGFGDVEAGDLVRLTLRTGPGWARVSSIARRNAVRAPEAGITPSSTPPAATEDASLGLASREAFDAQVATLAGQADRVDRVWNEFRRACKLMAENPRDDARGWFALWEGSVRPDLSGGFCRDLFNQIVDLGEPIKASMSAAEDVVRRTSSPGEIREIRRQHRMDWEGWGLQPPNKLDQ
jgi:hypothetical protein